MNAPILPHRGLGEVITLVKGRPPAQQPYFGAEAERYLTPEYLRGGLSAELVKPGNKAVRVSDGDTILLWDGSNAGEVMLGRSGVLASTMMRVSHCSDFDSRYFFYALQRWEPFLKGQTSGSGVPHLDKGIVRSLTIVEFPLPEQIGIAKVLSAVDLVMTRTKALIAKQLRIKAGLMHDLLAKGIDEDGKRRTEQTHEFKDSSPGRIPVQWSVRRLHAITDEVITYGIVQAGPHVENGVPYIRTGDMAGDWIDPSKLLRTSPAIAHAYRRSAVSSGDVVFALRATVGKVLPVPAILEGANLTQGTAKISPDAGTDSTFLLWAMRSPDVQNKIRLQEKGTTFAEITLRDLRLIELAIPSETEEQTRIGKVLASHEESLLAYRRSLDKLESLKAALMHDLLSGARRVASLHEGPSAS